jgi:hypothetical protein
MNYYISLFIEATFVGIGLIIVGSILAFLVRQWYPKPLLPKSCASYNKYYVMEFTLFLTGFLFHLMCEASGVNKWYLTNSAASYSS